MEFFNCYSKDRAKKIKYGNSLISYSFEYKDFTV